MYKNPITLAKTISKTFLSWLTKKKIERILRDASPPVTSRAEASFVHLQSTCKPPVPYGYTSWDMWNRGLNRNGSLCLIPGLETPGKKVLEVACGDGLVGTLLHHFGHEVVLVDSDDWRDPRAKVTPFHCCDACDTLPVGNDQFDLAYSYNAFEHFAQPEHVLKNIIQCVRRGGYIYLEFSPLFATPWGLHAYGTFNMPYPQFLFSPQFIQKTYNELGIHYYGVTQRIPMPVNEWRYTKFLDMFQQCGLRVLKCKTSTDISCLKLVLQYPEAFTGRHLTYNDLVIDGFRVLLQKP